MGRSDSPTPTITGARRDERELIGPTVLKFLAAGKAVACLV
jgi:hypothetical protein